MIMKEFGIENEKNILLIHGSGTTWKMYYTQINVLKKTYHVFAACINGHSIEEENTDYYTPEQEADDILKFFKNKNTDRIFLICGASLGAMIAIEVLIKKNDFSRYAFIESVPTRRFNSINTAIFCWWGKYILRRLAKGTKDLKDASFGNDLIFEETKRTLSGISPLTMHNILLTTCNYYIKESVQNIKAKTYMVYGSKEAKLCKKSADYFVESIPYGKSICMDGYKHGELSIGNPERHLKLISELISWK